MDVIEFVEKCLAVFIISICTFVSNFLLSTVQLETAKNEEQQRRLLNILYSHISILWQLDTIFCSAKVVIQIVYNVTDDNVENILNNMTDYDYVLGGLYFCSISVIRSIKHFYPDIYLCASYKCNGHWILPINISAAIFIKIVKYFTDGINIDMKEGSSQIIIFGTMTAFTISLHGIVAIDIFCRKYFLKDQVLPFQTVYSDDLINFSPGSSVFLALAIYLGILIIIFNTLSMPLTTTLSSLMQLINITAISLYWTISQDNLRHRAEKIARKFMFSRQNTFIVVIT